MDAELALVDLEEGGAPNAHLPNRPKILNFNAVVLENLAKSYVANPPLGGLASLPRGILDPPLRLHG